MCVNQAPGPLSETSDLGARTSGLGLGGGEIPCARDVECDEKASCEAGMSEVGMTVYDSDYGTHVSKRTESDSERTVR